MSVPEIDVDELEDRIASGSSVLDVREADEVAGGRVPGVLHIALGEIVERIADVPRDGTLYVICRSGGRSAKAVEFLRGQGVDAVNVAGGTLAWVESGRATESG